MSMKSSPELVDRLADRREQCDRMRRRNARGRLRRMVASLLEQEVLLGPLAATRDRSSCGREFVPSAIDEPRAGSVHALKSSEIEDHAFRVFSGGKERSPGRLELVSGGDDPLPSQRQHDPVRAVLSSYGRRRAHQALRPSRNGAHIAPPGDCRAKTTSSPTHTGIRATTNQVRIGDPVTRTQIREQSESIFVQASAQAFRIAASSWNRSFLARLQAHEA